jgi:hypothetical protein
MKTRSVRETVDLSEYPDLVVIYLGMRVRALAGLKTLAGIGPQIMRAGDERPDGLLHCENNLLYKLFPPHVGMRWYWRDFESMERWTRSEPHRRWWQEFLRDSAGTGFWHETYFASGGVEAVYIDMQQAVGLKAFAPVKPARGAGFSARRRARRQGDGQPQPDGMTERELY